ncbi:MAG TPA: hypothetical protein VLA34_06785 [Candidatus Krumholzibacterium sp.]|nr:hypothetical protein [Candidatus Krumholzibacterium sp.]
MKRVSILLFAVLLAAGCEGDRGPVGPEGPEGLPGSGIGYTNDPYVGFNWGGSFVEVASVTFDVPEDGTTVFFLATDNVWGPGAACKSALRLVFDGVADDRTLMMVDIPTATSSNNGASVATSAMKVLDAGSHTVMLERSGCMTDKHPHINVIVLSN